LKTFAYLLIMIIKKDIR